MKRFTRFLLTTLLVFFALAIAFVLLLPTLLSTTRGKELAIKLSKEPLAIDSVSLSWFSGQELQGVRYRNGLFSCEKITTDAPLWRMVLLREFSGTFTLKNGSALFTQEGMPPLALEEIEACFSLEGKRTELAASVNTVGGSITLQGSSSDLLSEEANVSLTANISHFPVRPFDEIVAIKNPKLQGVLEKLLGDTLEAKIDLKREAGVMGLLIDAKAPQFSAHLQVGVNQGIAALEGPSLVSWNLTKEAIEALTSQRVQQDVLATLKITDFHLPLDKPGFCFGIDALLSLSPIELENFTLAPLSATLHSRNIYEEPLTLDIASSQFTAQVVAKNLENITLHAKTQEGEINTRFGRQAERVIVHSLSFSYLLPVIEPWWHYPLCVEGHLDPFIFLNGEVKVAGELTLPEVPPRFQPLVGKTLTTRFSAKRSPSEYAGSMHLATESLTLNLAGALSHNTFSLTQPALATFTLTPEQYTALVGEAFALEKPTLLNITVDKLSFPCAPFNASEAKVDASVAMGSLSFIEKNSQKKGSLKDFFLSLSEKSFSLRGTVAQGTLQGEGTFDLPSSSINATVQANQIPTTSLDLVAAALMKPNLDLASLLGATFHSEIDLAITNNSGSLSLTLQAPKANASFKGTLTQGLLTLDEPIYAQIQLSTALNRLLFQGVAPLAEASFQAKAPLTFEVAAKGFSLPLFPFSLEKAVVPNVHLELGKIACQNVGNLNAALSLLKLSYYSKDKEVSLWFSPIDISLQNGLAKFERTDVLIEGAYQICSWGTIDLNKSYVDMTLGFTASCLEKAFKIPDLPKNYVLQVPLQGPLNDAQIDKGKATAKIGTLLLWQQKGRIVGGALGGPAGGLLGGFVNKITPLPDGDSKAPPARTPLPWDSAKATKSANKNKKHFKADENYLKQALKVVK